MSKLYTCSTAFSVSAICLIGWTAWAAEGPTFAERLGWPEGTRVLILHSDDLGMSHASNQGTFEALEFGMVTSCSAMMPTPWVAELAEYVRKHPETDVGLHVTADDLRRHLPG